MDAELDTLATALYVKIDDALKDNPGLAPRRPVVGICPKLSDAELLTLCVLQALGGFVSDARFLRHARAHLLGAFPYLPNQPGYNKRVRKAIPQLKAMIRLLAGDTDTFFDDLWVIDSTRSSAGGPGQPPAAPIWPDLLATGTAPATPGGSGGCACI